MDISFKDDITVIRPFRCFLHEEGIGLKRRRKKVKKGKGFEKETNIKYR
jgi:hypothetical protein